MSDTDTAQTGAIAPGAIAENPNPKRRRRQPTAAAPDFAAVGDPAPTVEDAQARIDRARDALRQAQRDMDAALRAQHWRRFLHRARANNNVVATVSGKIDLPEPVVRDLKCAYFTQDMVAMVELVFAPVGDGVRPVLHRGVHVDVTGRRRADGTDDPYEPAQYPGFVDPEKLANACRAKAFMLWGVFGDEDGGGAGAGAGAGAGTQAGGRQAAGKVAMLAAVDESCTVRYSAVVATALE